MFSSLCFQNLLLDVEEGAEEQNLIRTCFLVLLSLGGLGRGSWPGGLSHFISH